MRRGSPPIIDRQGEGSVVGRIGKLDALIRLHASLLAQLEDLVVVAG
jgi:hypothetical protein